MMFSILLAVLGFACIPGASAQTISGATMEGRWAVRLERRPVLLLDFKQDTTAPGGWRGSRAAAGFRMSEEHAFSKVAKKGGKAEPIVWSAARDGTTLEFRIGQERDIYVFRLLPDGSASLGWKGVAVQPLVLSRATAEETVPATWDYDRIYKAEDGHR